MLILALSWCARLALAASGGQYFFPDESRFARSFGLVGFIKRHDVGGALSYLVERADHTGWAVVGLPPAAVVSTLSAMTGRSPEQFGYIVAMMLSLASVACIALVFAVARRLGSSPGESLTAAGLFALAASFFYWSRHLLPYDSSMALALGALWVGLGRGGAKRSFASGVLAGIAFSVYNGYWTIAIIAVAIQTIVGARSMKRLLVRAVTGGLGLVLPTVLLLAVGGLVAQRNDIATMREFAASVKQGDWADGFTLPVAYLWQADRLLSLAWAVAFVIALIWLIGRPGQPGGLRAHVNTVYRKRLGADPAPRAMLLLACVASVYISLAGGAGIVRVFVVYGRLVRQLVPFLCLLTATVACALYRDWRYSRTALVTFGALAVLVQLFVAFGPPMMQTFPRELEARLFEYGRLDYALTVVGPAPRIGDPRSRFVLVNAQYLYPPRGAVAPPAGKVVLSVAHPLEYAPYRFEGFRAHERQILEDADISVRLVMRDTAAVTR